MYNYTASSIDIILPLIIYNNQTYYHLPNTLLQIEK